ncbi:MAG TPA: hypothetical protein PLX35_11970 [Cyclobacteriaceae bacterium]|nr:hypothetical protein [Cyclobacteriaceae bacterium]
MLHSINSAFLLAGVVMSGLACAQQSTPHPENAKASETIQDPAKTYVYFVDKFFVPENSVAAFKKQATHNLSVLRTLAGLIRSDAMEQVDHDGNTIIITVAVWENQDYAAKAKDAMMTEFKKIQFNPAEFYQRLDIKLERGLYTHLQE